MRKTHGSFAANAAQKGLPRLSPTPKCGHEGSSRAILLPSYLPVGLGPSFCSAFFFICALVQEFSSSRPPIWSAIGHSANAQPAHQHHLPRLKRFVAPPGSSCAAGRPRHAGLGLAGHGGCAKTGLPPPCGSFGIFRLFTLGRTA